mgnify:FL=1
METRIEQLREDLATTYFLEGGIEIPPEADMLSDTYKVPGNYFCHLSDRTKTLLNCPLRQAFTLKVDLAAGNGYPRQTFKEYNTQRIISRTYDGSNDVWMETVENATKNDIDKITTVNTELITNTGYKVLGHNITIKNGICYVYLYMECLEKKSEWTEMMGNLPRNPKYFEFSLAPVSSDAKTVSIRLVEGKIAAAYGVAGQRYNTYFSYPIITV